MPTYPGSATIHHTQLDNGITLLVYENFAAATVVVETMLRTGALAESHDKAGLSSFTANMLMRGTQKRDFAHIYDALESVGAGLSFSGNRHLTDFSGGGLVEDLDLILNLAAESLCLPTFPIDHVEQVRGETLTSLQMRANDTRQMAALKFQETLYKGHPYGISVEGYLESAAAGLAAAHSIDRTLRHLEPSPFPRETVLGALLHYLAHAETKHFAPVNAMLGLLPPLPDGTVDARTAKRAGGARGLKQARGLAYRERALAALEAHLGSLS